MWVVNAPFADTMLRKVSVRPVRVDGKRTHVSGKVLVDGIQVRLRRIERDERWVRGRNNLERRQPAIARIHLEHINAQGSALMRSSGRDAWKRVSADVDEPSLRIGWLGGGDRTRGDGGERCGRAKQRNKLTTSKAGRQWLLIKIGV